MGYWKNVSIEVEQYGDRIEGSSKWKQILYCKGHLWLKRPLMRYWQWRDTGKNSRKAQIKYHLLAQKVDALEHIIKCVKSDRPW